MTLIRLTDVSVEYPVYNANARSIKDRVLLAATGGGIEQRHGGQIVVKALDGISLEIAEGERVGVIGHNGSGKTTLLRVLCGIYQPTAGAVEIKGECVSLINLFLGIDPEATGRENIRLRAALMGRARINSRDFDKIADFSGLGSFLDMPVRTYSSGMLLRLAFAVSTFIRPEILIMDEWISTGDEEFKERANRRLQDVLDSTKILVVASHSKELLVEQCTRIIWLEHGKIRMDGPTDAVAETYFGS